MSKGKSYFTYGNMVNHAAQMGCRLFKIVMLFLSDKYTDMKLLYHMSLYFLTFEEYLYYFSIALAQIDILTC